MKTQAGNRWVIAVAGVVMQVALGAVYAWSVFRDPLIQAFGWTIPEVTLTFTIAILTLGFAAFVGGLWLGRTGPAHRRHRRAVCCTGWACSGRASQVDRLWLLYLTYGVIGGIGLGLGYIVPVATLVRWFPDRRGFITGLAVAGFGAGALDHRARGHATDPDRRRHRRPSPSWASCTWCWSSARRCSCATRPRATARRLAAHRDRGERTGRGASTRWGRRCAPGSGTRSGRCCF